MAHGFSNRVWVATATTGTGDVAIGAAKPAHCTPAQAGTLNGEERTWLLEEGNDFEIFRGAYVDSGPTATRGTVVLSMISGVVGTTRMNLAGTATLRVVSAAEDLLSALESGAAGRNILAAPDTNAALAALGSDLCWHAVPPGHIILVDTSTVGVAIPPQSHPNLVFVQLTAGLTGAGQYNAGKLRSESVSGSAPLTVATAIVDVAASPLYNQTIPLLNTEGAILRPLASGVGGLQQDQMQQIVGTWTNSILRGATGTGAMSVSGPAAANGVDGGSNSGSGIDFNSANSPNARTGSETRMKNRGVTAFRRVL